MTTKLFKIIKKEIQPDPRELDLYEILPRFIVEETPYVKERFLKPVQREFEWEGETFQLYINPISVEDEDGKYRQYFPGNQEAEIETALIELAARDDGSFFDGKKFAFTLRQLQNHLTAGGHQYSRERAFSTCVLFCLMGIFVVSYTTEVLHFLLRAIPLLIFMSLPLLNYFELTNLSFLKLFPVQGGLNLIINSYRESPDWGEVIFGYVSIAVWTPLVYWFVYRIFMAKIVKI
jgi:hypothetical protein